MSDGTDGGGASVTVVHPPPAAGRSDVDEHLAMRSDALVEMDADHRLRLWREPVEGSFGPLPTALRAAVEVLCGAGATEAGLRQVLGDDHDESDVAALTTLVAALDGGGWLERTLTVEGCPLVTVKPLAHRAVLVPRPLDPVRPVALSRFAFLRREDGHAVVESPRSIALLVLHDARLGALLVWLARPQLPADLDPGTIGLPGAALERVLGLLSDAGFLVRPGDDDEEGARALAQWSFADLLFHARSRLGRHANGYGKTYRFEDRFPRLPQRRDLPAPAVDLERPDLAAVAAADLPLTEVLERRRSVRAHDDDSPITVAQVGEFLYRAARVRATSVGKLEEGSDRPYPGAGGLYELELYPVVSTCAGLVPGVHRYDPFSHRLGLVAPLGPGARSLVETARQKSLMATTPQVLIVVAARFGRIMWTYESIAYALALKDVGVLYQTMYCVATAMGLAPCGLGGGDSDVFAEAAGLDYYDETSVGEFLLGSRPRTGG